MRRLFTKNQILTIPNLLSLIRLLLIPAIIYLYIVRQDRFFAVALIALSGLTDIVDGRIARHFNMVSDLGKILDPVADKLTQAAVLVCLVSRYELILPLIIIFAVKELCIGSLGAYAIKQYGDVNGAQWHGKLATVTLYVTMIVLMVLTDIPPAAANGVICLCIAAVLLSFIMYLRFFYLLFTSSK